VSGAVILGFLLEKEETRLMPKWKIKYNQTRLQFYDGVEAMKLERDKDDILLGGKGSFCRVPSLL
jgi:hypothetical protein